jgi:hypothetical protein
MSGPNGIVSRAVDGGQQVLADCVQLNGVAQPCGQPGTVMSAGMARPVQALAYKRMRMLSGLEGAAATASAAPTLRPS